MRFSSSIVQPPFLISGLRWFCQRSRHCFPDRAVFSLAAIWTQWFFCSSSKTWFSMILRRAASSWKLPVKKTFCVNFHNIIDTILTEDRTYCMCPRQSWFSTFRELRLHVRTFGSNMRSSSCMPHRIVCSKWRSKYSSTRQRRHRRGPRGSTSSVGFIATATNPMEFMVRRGRMTVDRRNIVHELKILSAEERALLQELHCGKAHNSSIETHDGEFNHNLAQHFGSKERFLFRSWTIGWFSPICTINLLAIKDKGPFEDVFNQPETITFKSGLWWETDDCWWWNLQWSVRTCLWLCHRWRWNVYFVTSRTS